MVKFIKNADLTYDDICEVSEIQGKITSWLLEKKSLDYMSKELNLPPRCVLENMCETIYQYMKFVGGPWRYLRWLIHKKH